MMRRKAFEEFILGMTAFVVCFFACCCVCFGSNALCYKCRGRNDDDFERTNDVVVLDSAHRLPHLLTDT